MRKALLLFLSFIVSLPLVASVHHASGVSLDSVSGEASATVVLDYRNDFARIGFTSAKVASDDFAAKAEISEAALVKDASRSASSEGTAIWCFWQINNSSEYNVMLSSDGIRSSDGKTLYGNWSVSISDRGDGSTLRISGDGDKSAVIKTKTGTQSESGSCSLVITVSDYPSMPADSYVLPIVLTLESVS